MKNLLADQTRERLAEMWKQRDELAAELKTLKEKKYENTGK